MLFLPCRRAETTVGTAMVMDIVMRDIMEERVSTRATEGEEDLD